jgi:anti-sigma B factor antagonist
MTAGMDPEDAFDVGLQRDDRRLVLRPRGELDIATVPRLRDAIAQRRPDEGIVLDLRDLAFLDTSGLQIVVEVGRRARTEGFELTLVRGAKGVQRVFEIAGLVDMLPFADRAPGDGGDTG